MSAGAVAGSARPGKRIAANPIPYWSKAGKTKAVFDQAFADFAEIGFTAVKADVPEGMAVKEYAAWIAGYGLAPSLSLLSGAGLRGPPAVAPLARRRGVRDRGGDQPAAGRARPGPDRLRPGHRPPPLGRRRPGVVHREVRRPDRRDPHQDCFADLLDGRGSGTYHDQTSTKRLWAEPGLGVIDFDAVIAALPADYDGDFMMEIDEPSVDSKLESHRISFQWAKGSLPVAA